VTELPGESPEPNRLRLTVAYAEARPATEQSPSSRPSSWHIGSQLTGRTTTSTLPLPSAPLAALSTISRAWARLRVLSLPTWPSWTSASLNGEALMVAMLTRVDEEEGGLVKQGRDGAS
jgi:hypothetical protein